MSTHTEPERVVATGEPAWPAVPTSPPAQWGVAAVGATLMVALLFVALATEGLAEAGLLVLGTGLGFALFHSRFGFTSAWRQLVAVGQGKALRAHTLLLAATAILFAPLLATGSARPASRSAGTSHP